MSEPPQLSPFEVMEHRLYFELLALSLRLSPHILWRKVILASYIHDLILLVISQSS